MTKISDVSSSGTKKVVTKGFDPIPADLVEELRDGKLLEKKNNDEAPVITENDVAALPDELGLDRTLLIRAPKPEERLDWGSENWTTLGIDYLRDAVQVVEIRSGLLFRPATCQSPFEI